MDRIVVVSLVLVLGSIASGCGGVRYLVRGERAGIVELRGGLVDATARAHVVMTEHCEGRWRLVEGEEALAIARTAASAKSDRLAVTPIDADALSVDDRHLAFECLD